MRHLGKAFVLSGILGKNAVVPMVYFCLTNKQRLRTTRRPLSPLEVDVVVVVVILRVEGPVVA